VAEKAREKLVMIEKFLVKPGALADHPTMGLVLIESFPFELAGKSCCWVRPTDPGRRECECISTLSSLFQAFNFHDRIVGETYHEQKINQNKS
jgi:hypothetical protein